jgi:hypothetical protein
VAHERLRLWTASHHSGAMVHSLAAGDYDHMITLHSHNSYTQRIESLESGAETSDGAYVTCAVPLGRFTPFVAPRRAHLHAQPVHTAALLQPPRRRSQAARPSSCSRRRTRPRTIAPPHRRPTSVFSNSRSSIGTRTRLISRTPCRRCKHSPSRSPLSSTAPPPSRRARARAVATAAGLTRSSQRECARREAMHQWRSSGAAIASRVVRAASVPNHLVPGRGHQEHDSIRAERRRRGSC